MHIVQVWQLLSQIVTVPARALHQVENLRPCVKVAFDYVRAEDLPALAWTHRHLVPSANKFFNLPQDYLGLLHGIKEHLARVADHEQKKL